jgi:hypothetical protein
MEAMLTIEGAMDTKVFRVYVGQVLRPTLRPGDIVIMDNLRAHKASGIREANEQILANIYLHYVFDLWVDAWRKNVAQGEVIIIRFADDIVLAFEHRADAVQLGTELRDRLQQFGLELNAEKTRLIEFGPSAMGRWLGSVVKGYFNYHAVPGNMRTLSTFRRRVIRL